MMTATSTHGTSSRHIGYACSYLPEEIVMAAGFVPRRIMPETRPAEADAHIHANTCHYVKALLAAALEGETPELDGFVVTNSCDGMRRLYDVWREYVAGVPVFFLDVPKKHDSDAVAFFASELRRLAETLERQLPNARVSDERLEDAIRTCNTIRRQMSEVLTLQKEAAPRVRGRDFFDLTSGAAEHTPSDLRDRIDQFLSKIDEKGCAPRGPRIVLSGNMINRPDLLTLIEDAGGHVVALDTCFGVRHYDLLVEEDTGDPMLALATRYLLRSPCPRMHGLERRFEYLKDLVESSGAAGVIYSTVKFCDSHLYDLPLLEEGLRQAGIPFLWLENDYEWTGLGQLRTRVEAFLEML
jgi:benzoyl-CoA reductase/2-hydroxyglutaryl-CoA dehydratase subunit BcrC/BadD/HgdB